MWTTIELLIISAALSAVAWILGARHGFWVGVDEGVNKTVAALLGYKLAQCDCPKCVARRSKEAESPSR